MEDKLNKIIEMLEDINFKIEFIEIDITEIKEGVNENTIKARINLLKHSATITELRVKRLNLPSD